MSGLGRRCGFTLLELLGVLAIICVLFGLVVLAGAYARRAARESKARSDIEFLHAALEEYKLEQGVFPSIADSNATALAATAVKNWLPPSFTFLDPWQRPYVYHYDPAHRHVYTLYSRGPDGLSGNATNDLDNIH